MLADDLLEQARLLADYDDRRPKQANLRRSISSAYYAVFHLLVWDAASRMCPPVPAALRRQTARAFSHKEMRDVCRPISRGSLTPPMNRLVAAQGFSPKLREVAGNFVLLQDERHRADYDLAIGFSKVEANAILRRAEAVFVAWDSVRLTEEANVFCAALLLGTRWAK